MTTHFQKWSIAYQHYIEPWYNGFIAIFLQRGMTAPDRNEFYFFCYINTRKLYDPKYKKNVPRIVLTPLREEGLMFREEYLCKREQNE
jgi:hypothetical protein